MEDEEAVAWAEQDAEMDRKETESMGIYSSSYDSRYAAMKLAVEYTGGRSVGWPNLKKLADDIDVYLREGK